MASALDFNPENTPLAQKETSKDKEKESRKDVSSYIQKDSMLRDTSLSFMNSMKIEANVFYSRGTNYGNKPFKKPKSSYGGSVKNPVCTYCHKEGHTVNICYKKHGFPPGYQFISKMGNASYANHVEAGQYTIAKVMSNSDKEVLSKKHKGFR
ncbi:conserved hypothetical protein [Ricinus communis]|uniref:Uncharacterized protein n=1 Tax=Ricinus communis TaxID=3988 RepID=B9T4C0_RICCO|nr:conserved hypothetical protein [Ricinus communis]